VLALPAFAQETGGQKLVAQAPTGALTITTLEGEGAKNDVRARTATAPVVEVKDAAGKPVAGAEVVFQLPATGPGGSFNGWLKTQTVRSDEQGKAAVTGYSPNMEEGRFNIKVTATFGNQSGTIVIAQANVSGTGTAASAKGKNKWWKYAVAAGAVAALGGAVAARGSDTATTAATTPVTITPGAVGVGGPR
jgi:hypothetical protein